MTVDGVFAPVLKRRRYSSIDSMDSEAAKAKLAELKEKFGREIRVFETAAASTAQNPAPQNDEADEFYEFTAEDYHRILSTRKQDKVLKTKKLRDAEEAARRSRMTKTVMRVRFPDNNTLEATFHPSEKIQSLVELLQKVIARPELPFYLYTTPPKKLIKDASLDFYAAGFIPGAIVYFSYDVPKGDAAAADSGPFLSEDVIVLKGLDLEAITEQVKPVESAPEPEQASAAPPAVARERKPAEKKLVKPKWLKM